MAIKHFLNDNYTINYIGPTLSVRIKTKDPYYFDKILSEEIIKILKDDPTLKYHYDGEYEGLIIYDLDLLHVDSVVKKISEKVDIDIEKPNAIYRERITKKSRKFATYSPNKRNNIIFHVEPLDEKTESLVLSGKLDAIKNYQQLTSLLIKNANWNAESANRVFDVFQGCLLINSAKEIQMLDTVKDHIKNPFEIPWFDTVKHYIIDQFEIQVRQGILAKEPLSGFKAKISDLIIHENPKYADHEQITKMVMGIFTESLRDAEPHLYEPIHKLFMKIPKKFEGSMTMLIKKHRGLILNLLSGDEYTTIECLIPTSELIDIADRIKKNIQDMGFFKEKFYTFKKIPSSLEKKLILKLQGRKKVSRGIHSMKYINSIIDRADEKMKMMREKIISTMNAQEITHLKIDRRYLLEFMDTSLCDFYDDNLPKLKPIFHRYLNYTGIYMQYEGSTIKFIYNKAINLH